MRYIGCNDDQHFLRCGRCRQVLAYSKSLLTGSHSGECPHCRRPYSRIFGLPDGGRASRTLKLLVPLFVMLALSGVILAALAVPYFQMNYQFNKIITTLSPMMVSTLIPLICALLAVVPAAASWKKGEEDVAPVNPILLVFVCAVGFIFILNIYIDTAYSPLTLTDESTGEDQPYFGSVIAEKASGQGRLFDIEGNLVYQGGFKNNLMDGNGKKYEQINATRSMTMAKKYECVFSGEFREGKIHGKGDLFQYDAEYTFEKGPGESPYLVYSGEFREGEYCGYGTLYTLTTKYQGGFFGGERNGYAAEWSLGNDSKVYRFESVYQNGKLHGEGKKYFPNGMLLFKGTYKEGASVGDGKKFREDGTLQYAGSFNGNDYEGEGTTYWEDGETIRYSGGWKEGKASGEGRIVRSDGTLEYEGGWLSDRYNGYGTLYWEDGTTVRCVGNWANGVSQGLGKVYRKNGTLDYDGNWNANRREGNGKAYASDGTTLIYEGGWLQGQKHGKGEQFHSDSGIRQFTGTWENGAMLGEGCWYWENGNLYYEGSFKDGKLDGQGTVYNHDTSLRYKGGFANGEYNGYGVTYWTEDQPKYIGTYKNGKRDGEGKEYAEDGSLLYEGFFSEDQYNGSGTLFTEEGPVRGTFANGKLVEQNG